MRDASSWPRNHPSICSYVIVRVPLWSLRRARIHRGNRRVDQTHGISSPHVIDGDTGVFPGLFYIYLEVGVA